MKDLGEANVILGIKITRIENGISLDQSHYIGKILKKYNYFESKPACTPYDSSVKLFKNTGDSVNQSKYVNTIGSLRYVVDCTRPDIAYAVGLLCYSDFDWNSLSDDSKATTGYIFNIAGGVVG
ncbi:putative Polyprotein [Cucumis melo var. makuwa]|uniref:Polyprotein n=1 Tax=Cucumis melo var. makuwa TaxID=1194695 RepID=A0A5A7UQ39_CUCMM|nr:putative Polyprotein [Cucumis melo var. makuwa]TYK29095.1 putative Polyprotein [Cucumis melo var. makuwa]